MPRTICRQFLSDSESGWHLYLPGTPKRSIKKGVMENGFNSREQSVTIVLANANANDDDDDDNGSTVLVTNW
jgi:hypothetical protein